MADFLPGRSTRSNSGPRFEGAKHFLSTGSPLNGNLVGPLINIRWSPSGATPFSSQLVLVTRHAWVLLLIILHYIKNFYRWVAFIVNAWIHGIIQTECRPLTCGISI